MQPMAKVNELLTLIPLHEFISVFNEWKRRFIERIETGKVIA
jgi:hypothetical protein